MVFHYGFSKIFILCVYIILMCVGFPSAIPAIINVNGVHYVSQIEKGYDFFMDRCYRVSYFRYDDGEQLYFIELVALSKRIACIKMCVCLIRSGEIGIIK